MKYHATFTPLDRTVFQHDEEMVATPMDARQEMSRERLHTADTLVVRNTPLDGKVIETSPKADPDDCSLVSSLSNDDSLIGPSQSQIETGLRGLSIASLTPEEINVGESSIPQWLENGDLFPPAPQATSRPDIVRRAETEQTPYHHRCVKTLIPSPTIPRPSFGRIKSCPTTTLDFSATGTPPASFPLESLDESSSRLDFSRAAPDPWLRKKDSQLLGNRPRRHVRNKSATSVSSSMSLTAPSTASSMSLQNASTLDDETASTLSSRKKAGRYVRKEFNYVLNRLGSPIQKIKKRQEADSIDWRRSKGCLT